MLDFGKGAIRFILMSFPCKEFLSPDVCDRKYCRLGGHALQPSLVRPVFGIYIVMLLRVEQSETIEYFMYVNYNNPNHKRMKMCKIIVKKFSSIANYNGNFRLILGSLKNFNKVSRLFEKFAIVLRKKILVNKVIAAKINVPYKSLKQAENLSFGES